MYGLEGSLGKKGCSERVCSASCAVAILAAGLVVVAMGLRAERRVTGGKREEARKIEAMAEIILVCKWQRDSTVILKYSGLLCFSGSRVNCRELDLFNVLFASLMEDFRVMAARW